MSNSSINELFAHSSLLELPKKHILTSSFQNDKNFYFIEKGIARSYCVINDKELTSWFSTEGDIVFSTNNFYGNQQGYEYEVVQLLENTVLYAVPIKDLEKLYQTNIEIANWSRILHQEAFIMNEKRLISRLYKSAEERYIELLQTRPDLFQRVNLGYIASFLGILMVICIHCSDPFNVSPEARLNPEYNLWGSIYGAFLRPCVPLFVMLTGMLLLPVEQEIGQFYKKRMLRVIVPFIVWSLLYNLFPWFTGILGLNNSVLSEMFAYAGESPSQTWDSCLHNILMIPFNFNTYTVPLWYIYMLIGLYLYMPFFSAWLKQATEKQMKIFLSVWFITLFLPYCQEYISSYIGGTCAWNDYGTLYYFSGFSGYLLLGYYLKDRNKLSVKKTVVLSLILFTVGYAITYYGFRNMTSQPDITERQMELFFLYCSPNVFLMTVAWYLLIQKVKVTSPLMISALKNITKCGLGIYTVHYFAVGIGYLAIDRIDLPIFMRIPATALFVFIVSWCIVALFYKVLPKAAKWIMG